MGTESTIEHLAETPFRAEDTAGSKVAKAAARTRAVEKIRSELNVEKWPAMWQPAKSKNRPTLRTMEREITATDGTRIVSRVEVGYTQLGTLTTEEQKMLYVLIKLWEDSGKPNTQVFFSSRELARMLKKKGWGTNVIQAITKSLRKLRTIPIEWINSYHDRTNNGDVLVDRRPFTLLGELRVVERKHDGAVNSSQGYFKFDDHILTNLQLNYTKPVCIEEFFKLKSEVAQLIYSHVDLMLFDKSKYERRSRELFNDLGLKNHEYTHMYERKRAIERALKELEGIRLSSGVLKSATIEKTNDGKDYKVAFSKGAAARIEVGVESAPELIPPSVVINEYFAQKDSLQMQGEELVAEFYKRFHNVLNRGADSKQVAQAISLIVHHGFEAAQFIIEYSWKAAQETNYQPQTFGGILQYTSRALAEYDRLKAARERINTRIPAMPAEQPQNNPQAIAALERLSEEERTMLHDRVKTNLFERYSFIARHAADKSMVVEAMIHGGMLQELERQLLPAESMAIDNPVAADEVTPASTPVPLSEHQDGAPATDGLPTQAADGIETTPSEEVADIINAPATDENSHND